MRKILIIGIIIIVLFIVIIGFVIAGFFTGIFGIPSIKNIDNSWGEVTADTTEIITNVTIENPNPFDISLSQIEYTITMNNITMAEGLDQGATLKEGESTIQISSFLDNSKISQWWPSHIINNEITILEITSRVVLDAWLLQPPVEVPSRTQTITTDFLNSITNTEPRDVSIGPLNVTMHSVSAEWGSINDDWIELILNISVYNPYSNILSIAPQVGCEITMNNVSVGNGSAKDSIIIQADNDSRLTLVTLINNNKLDEWFVTHIQNGEHTRIDMIFDLAVEFEGKSYVLDDLITYSYNFDTNILDST